MFVKFLAPATLAGLVLTASLMPVGAAAQQAAPTPVTDSSFIQMASSLGLLQAKLGKVAEEKASSPAVRDFGKRMAAEYAEANEQLAAGAKQAAYPAPVMLRQHQLVYDRLSRTGRGSFDKKYMAEMLTDHGVAVQLYQQESQNGRVALLKQLATELLPTVQQHLTLATQTATSVGAEVTATASNR